MDEVDTMFVDCYQKDFWVIWLCRLLDFKEFWTKGWPFVDDFQELYFGFIRRHSSFFVVVGNDMLRKKQLKGKNTRKCIFHHETCLVLKRIQYLDFSIQLKYTIVGVNKIPVPVQASLFPEAKFYYTNTKSFNILICESTKPGTCHISCCHLLQ